MHVRVCVCICEVGFQAIAMGNLQSRIDREQRIIERDAEEIKLTDTNVRLTVYYGYDICVIHYIHRLTCLLSYMLLCVC